MSNKKESVLLIPGPDGWEIWQGSQESGFRKTLENGPLQASGLEGIPPGRLLMSFPVRQALAVPFKVQTEDDAMFEDLASMHLEKSGIRPESDAGQLTDVFAAGNDEGQTTLLSVVLSAPAADGLPIRSPGAFDISARFFPMAADTVTIWRELGRWVFAVNSGGHLAYFQALSSDGLGANAIRDIQLAVTQLGLQGVNLAINKVVIWKSGHDSDPTDEEVQTFGDELGAKIASEPKPRPVIPDPMSHILPADARAHQRFKQEKQKRKLIIAAVLIIYFGMVGYHAFDYFKLSEKLKKQNERLQVVKSQHLDVGLFNADWEQLAPVVDSQHWPLQLLYRAATIIPNAQGLRFKIFEASRERIVIRGEATEIELTSDYESKLRRALSDYEWSFPPAEPDNKTNRWKFTYEGTLKEETLKGETE